MQSLDLEVSRRWQLELGLGVLDLVLEHVLERVVVLVLLQVQLDQQLQDRVYVLRQISVLLIVSETDGYLLQFFQH